MKTSISLILFFIIFSNQSVWASCDTVQKNGAINSIQKAISMEKNGDTILVEPGIYKEKNIIVDKSIVLIGNQYPVLDGEHTYEIISVKANNVTVKGI